MTIATTAALAMACGGPPAPNAPAATDDAGALVVGSSPPPVVTTPPAPRASSAVPPEPPAPSVTIDDTGVGDVKVGQPVPRAMLDDANDPRGRYDIRWIADAQPFEAFRVGDPARSAVFEGPFTKWAKSHAGPLEPQKFSADALKAVRAGAPVRWIVVEQPGLVTRERIGVGSTFDALSAAYPGIKVLQNPEWFDSKPTCAATSPALAKVMFLLAQCAPAKNGDVVRIVVGR